MSFGEKIKTTTKKLLELQKICILYLCFYCFIFSLSLGEKPKIKNADRLILIFACLISFWIFFVVGTIFIKIEYNIVEGAKYCEKQ